ncbi:glutaredoxin-C4 [Drosophila grimshawi]|uniref:Glutaredoxin-2, mitochondrial n=1 Tax=Drosophila grimshawi TaxID=7222 RepID=B4J6A0_DROGR|nr:glutaredoxin-C4 [Drosophila grimshawi]EDW00873.1 GH21128 [Drosophila grimshawi]
MGSIVSEMQQPIVFVNMDSPAAQFVRQTINDNKVVIFSKSYCPYCSMAKEQFRKLDVKAHVVELDLRSDGEEIQAVLGEMTGARTVPRCFINGKFVGGGTDVKRLCDQGILQKYFQ